MAAPLYTAGIAAALALGAYLYAAAAEGVADLAMVGSDAQVELNARQLAVAKTTAAADSNADGK